MKLKRIAFWMALASAVSAAGASDVLVNLYSDRTCTFTTSEERSYTVVEDDWMEKVGTAGGWYWYAMALHTLEDLSAYRTGYLTSWYTYPSRPTTRWAEGSEQATKLIAEKETLTETEIYAKAALAYDGTRRVLYACFRPIEYDIVYDGNGATSGSMALTPCVYDTEQALRPLGFVRTGYTFIGWSRKPNGEVVFADEAVVSNLTTVNDDTVTLYAQWRLDVYTVTLDRRGGTGGTSTVAASYGLPLPSATGPTRKGYDFLGYFGLATAGTQYYAADMTSLTAWDQTTDTTLYAHWQAHSYRVLYDGNGSDSATMSDSTFTYDQAGELNANAYLLPGHAFDGWATSAAGPVVYKNRATVTNLTAVNDARITLYAHWTPRQYLVDLDSNGGTTSNKFVMVTYGSHLPTINVPVRTGYLFKGYTDARSGGVEYYVQPSPPTAPTTSGAHVWNKDSDAVLYAQWSPASYLVTLDDNGGSGGSGSVMMTYQSALPWCEIPVRVGYEFAGYYDAPTGGVRYYTASMASARNWDKPQGITLYAHWTAGQYRVVLDDNGGSGGSGQVQVTFDKAMPTAKAPTRAGYVFTGYYNAQEAGVCYYRGDMTTARVWDIADTCTLFAHWQSKVYEVALDANDGESGTRSVQVAYQQDLPSGAKGPTAPTRTGYVFAGYYDAKRAGEGTQYYDASMKVRRKWDKASEGVTLYAHWTAKTYVVTLNGNGGKASVDQVTATFDAVLPTVDAPTWSGRVFAGYYDAVVGGTQYYSPSMTGVCAWQRDEDAELYAHWEAQKFQVTLDDTDGRGGSGRVEVAYGADLPVVKAPTRTGYDFVGYWSKPTGGYCYYNYDLTPARNWDRTEATTLYAQWTPATYVVKLNANEGDGGATNVTVTYQATLPTGLEAPARAGYVFAGYWDDVRNGKQYYAADMTGLRVWDKTDDDVTLYAHWAASSYTLTLDPNGGEAAQPSIDVPFASDNLPSVTGLPTRVGYTFAGFYDAPTAGVQYYLYNGRAVTGRTWTQPNDGTLYAQWAPVGQLTVTLNGNGGSGGLSSIKVTYNEPMPALSSAPQRPGYAFIGYCDEPTGGTLYYQGDHSSAHVWDKPVGATLYAQWRAKAYELQWDLTGGSGYTNVITAVYDAELPSGLAVPQRAGYAFVGYFDSPRGAGKQYYTADMTSCATWDKTLARAILYASWAANDYTLTFDAQGGTGGTTNATVTFDKALPAIVAPTRRGYTYLGYWQYKSGGTQYYDATHAVVNPWKTPSDMTLYAHWATNAYALTLSDGVGNAVVKTNAYDQPLPTITAPVRTGYQFLGYYDAQGTCYYSAACEPVVTTWTETNAVTVTAHWAAKPYALTFDDAAGCGGPVAIQVAYDAPVPSGLRAPQRRGYTFMGYADDQGELYYDANMICVKSCTGAKTLHALWSANTYTVTLMSAGAEQGELVLTNDVAQILPSPDPRTGYAFLGWGRTGISVDFAPGQEVVNLTYIANTNVTLYAIWEARSEPSEYAKALGCEGLEVEYLNELHSTNMWSVKNGAVYGLSVGNSVTAYPTNAAHPGVGYYLAKLVTKLPRAGRLEFRWNGGEYDSRGEYTKPSSSSSKFYMTFDRSGTIVTNFKFSASSQSWSNYAISVESATTFGIKLTRQSFSSYVYLSQFVWTPDECDLTVNTDGHGVISNIADNVVLTGKKSYTNGAVLNLIAVPQPDYEFDHWAGAVTGSTERLSVTLTNDQTVVAHFRPAGRPEPNVRAFGFDPVEVSWEKLGWAEAYLVERDGELIRILSGSVTNCVDETADQGVVYEYRVGAQVGSQVIWSEAKSVTRGKANLKALQIVGETFDLPHGKSRSFVCEGIYEDGRTNVVAATWRIASGEAYATVAAIGTEATVMAGDPQGVSRSVKPEASFAGQSATLTFNVVPVWQTTTVALNVDGGSGETSVQAKVGEPIGKLPTPVKAHHTFDGWYVGANKITAETLATADMKLTAKWTKNSYTVVVCGNGAKTAAGEDRKVLTYAWDEAKKIDNTFESADATFCGWGYTPTQVDFAPNALLKNLTEEADGVVRLYAVWERTDVLGAWAEILDCEKDAAVLKLAQFGSAATNAWQPDVVYQAGTAASLRFADTNDLVSAGVRVTLPSSGHLDCQAFVDGLWRDVSVTNRTSAPMDVLLKAEAGVVAEALQFRLDKFSWRPDFCTLTVTTNGFGYVKMNDTPITSVSAADGATVCLTAVPGAGMEFAGWSGAASAGDAALDFQLTGNETLTASFRTIGPQVTRLEITGGASVIYAGSEATFGCRAYYTAGDSKSITPGRWKLSPETYATVSSGVVRVNGTLGNVERVLTLTAEYVQDGRTLTATTNFTVRPLELQATLTFDAHGGACASDRIVRAQGAAAGELPVATWAEHIFLGWFTAKSGGAQITSTTRLYGDTTAYAHWEAAALERIEIAGGESRLVSGETASFTCTAFFTDGHSETVAAKWEFTQGAQYATVDDLGTVTAGKVGADQSVTLQANYSWRETSKTADAVLTITPYVPPVTPSSPQLVSLAISGGANELTIGSETTFSCMATFTNATPPQTETRVVTPVWMLTQGGEFATVGEDGTVTAQDPNRDRWELVLRAVYTDGLSECVAMTNLWIVRSATYRTVTFDAQDGSAVTSKRIELNETLGDLPAVSRAGYNFIGWFTTPKVGGQCLTKDTVVTDDMTAYGRWSVVVKLTALNVLGDATELYAGSNATFSCEAIYSDASSRYVESVWSIIDGGDYAKVDAHGMLTAEANLGGTAHDVVLQAAYAEGTIALTKTRTIVVKPLPQPPSPGPEPEPEPEPVVTNLTGVVIGGGTNALYAGSNAMFSCTAHYSTSDGAVFERDVAPTWTIVEGNTYATVDVNGMVTALDPGTENQTVTLQAAYSEGDVTKTDTCAITILPTPKPDPGPGPEPEPEPDTYDLARGVELLEPIVIGVSDPDTVKSVTAQGLPSGLDYTWTKTTASGAASAVYGTPKKSGIYAATFVVTRKNGKSDTPIAKTFIVRAANETCVNVVCDTARGKVSGAGVYAVGKKVALKATVAKGFVFAGWYDDAGTLVSQSATYRYKVGLEDIALEARFRSVAELMGAVSVTVGDVVFTAKNTTALATVSTAMAVAWDVIVDSESAAKLTVSGLPSGLKYKNGQIVGVPTRGGKTNTVKLTLKIGKLSQVFVLNVAVTALPDFVVGTFTGGATGADAGSATLKVTAAGKITGKWISGGKTWNLSASSFAAGDLEKGVYSANLVAKYGKVTQTLPLTIDETGVAQTDLFEALWSNWKVNPWKSIVKSSIKNVTDTIVFEDGAIDVKFLSTGSVKAKGSFGAYTTSVSSVLCPVDGQENVFALFLYFPPKTRGAVEFLGYAQWYSYVIRDGKLVRVDAE